MDKNDPPVSFGVFKPVGHTVIAFASDADLQAAQAALLDQGFDSSALVHYTPEEMTAQVGAELQNNSALTSFGQERNLILAHRVLAQRGCSFLVVHAPASDAAERVAAVARTMNAVAAQSYGRFIIEELIDAPASEGQVFESPERGLDLPAAGPPLH